MLWNSEEGKPLLAEDIREYLIHHKGRTGFEHREMREETHGETEAKSLARTQLPRGRLREILLEMSPKNSLFRA